MEKTMRQTTRWILAMGLGITGLVASAHAEERDLLVTAEGKAANVTNEICEFEASDPWQKSFGLKHRKFSSKGQNRYMILEPNHQLTLEGNKGTDHVKLVITVLNETKMIGSVETRIVEERETVNGELIEVARNYFAICQDTKSIFYFGEDVDNYKGGKIENHHGTWLVGQKAIPGIIMPAEPILGAKYYQEISPGEALDRAEIKGVHHDVKTPAGDFEDCLTVEESTPLEPGIMEYKRFAPGIGLIDDNGLLLTKHGFVK